MHLKLDSHLRLNNFSLQPEMLDHQGLLLPFKENVSTDNL